MPSRVDRQPLKHLISDQDSLITDELLINVLVRGKIMAAAIGNTYASVTAGRTKERHIYEGLMREVMQEPIKLKRALAAVLDKAAEGDLAALDWIACRLEGKPTQAVQVDTDGAIEFQAIQLRVVRAEPKVINGEVAIAPEIPETPNPQVLDNATK